MISQRLVAYRNQTEPLLDYYGKKNLLRTVDDYQPDLLGMSMITRDYRGFYRTLEAVRRHSGRLKIVAGIQNACAKRPVETEAIEELGQ